MKILLLVLTSILIPTPELAIYKNDEFRFEVKFPKQHQEEVQLLEEKFGSIDYLVLSGQEAMQEGELKGNVVFKVIAYRYQTNESFKRSGTTLHDLIYNHTKYINEESFLNNNFIILSENHSKDVLNYIVGDNSMEFITHKKIVIRNDMAYSVSIMSRSGLLTQEYIDSFFKSLKIKAI